MSQDRIPEKMTAEQVSRLHDKKCPYCNEPLVERKHTPSVIKLMCGHEIPITYRQEHAGGF